MKQDTHAIAKLTTLHNNNFSINKLSSAFGGTDSVVRILRYNNYTIMLYL